MNTMHVLWRRGIVFIGAAMLPIAGLAGCVTIGQPFAANRVSSIQLGKTKQYEIVQSFGHPFRTGEEDGDVTWTYVDYRLKVFGPQNTQDLYIRFNPDGTVKSYSFSSNAPDESQKKTVKRGTS